MPTAHSALDRFAGGVLERWRLRFSADSARHRDAAERVTDRMGEYTNLTPGQHAAGIRTLKQIVGSRGHTAETLDEALARVSLIAFRVLGLMPHASQLQAAHALLAGRFVEMATGEGKTLATALAAASAALDGTPVHVLTANDYLAERDATRLAPMYRALGLRVGCVLPAMDDDARREAYAADVVHVTGKQVAFDWLRDALAGGRERDGLAARLADLTQASSQTAPRPLLRGLCMALVDEADSLLVDEARTPLVLAAPREDGATADTDASVALGLARLLVRDTDFTCQIATREIEITDIGQDKLNRLAERVAGIWCASRFRDERVRQALAALHVWQRDRDYIVREGRVTLVDELSGRPLPDRRLQQGLHRLLELKERCETTDENDIVASLPFQRFFQRYHRLGGTSGTLLEVAPELARVYGGRVHTVPLNEPSRRHILPPRVFRQRGEQLDAMLEEVRRCQNAGRPVLIGTRSVEQSAGVSATLEARGIPHQLLNARQDGEEATIIARAGRRGRVTVATNMAGRGTDIPLGPGVAAAGGLHVVSLAFNDSRRVDRQLEGRAARQGDPGTARALICLDDDVLVQALPGGMVKLVSMLGRGSCPSSPGGSAASCSESADKAGAVDRLATKVVAWAQRRVERQHARERLAALAARDRIAHHIAIGGQPDDPA